MITPASYAFAASLDFAEVEDRALFDVYAQLSPDGLAANTTLDNRRLARLLSQGAGTWDVGVVTTVLSRRRMPAALRGQARARIPDARSAAIYLATQPVEREDIEALLGRFLDEMTGEDIDRLWRCVPRLAILSSSASADFYRALAALPGGDDEVATAQLTYLALAGPGDVDQAEREVARLLDVAGSAPSVLLMNLPPVLRALAYLVEHRPELHAALVDYASGSGTDQLRTGPVWVTDTLLTSRRFTDPGLQRTLLGWLARAGTNRTQRHYWVKMLAAAAASPLISDDVLAEAWSQAGLHLTRFPGVTRLREAWRRAGVAPTGRETADYDPRVAWPWIHYVTREAESWHGLASSLSYAYLITALKDWGQGTGVGARGATPLGDPRVGDLVAIRSLSTRLRRRLARELHSWQNPRPDPHSARIGPTPLVRSARGSAFLFNLGSTTWPSMTLRAVATQLGPSPEAHRLAHALASEWTTGSGALVETVRALVTTTER